MNLNFFSFRINLKLQSSSLEDLFTFDSWQVDISTLVNANTVSNDPQASILVSARACNKLALSLLFNVNNQHVKNGAQVCICLECLNKGAILIRMLSQLYELRVAEFWADEDNTIINVCQVINDHSLAKKLELYIWNFEFIGAHFFKD